MTLASPKTVLVTGASGYVGGMTCRFLEQRGWRVLRGGRRPVDSVFLDFSRPMAIASTTIEGRIDAVVHCAAANEVLCARSPVEAAEINVTGTAALLECAVANRIPSFIYLSTFHVFGSPSGVLHEGREPAPETVYGLTHAQAEQWVWQQDKRGVIQGSVVRPSNIFGMPEQISRCDRWSLVPLGFVRDAVRTGQIVLKTPGLQERNWVSADTVNEAILGMLEGRWASRLAHAAGAHTTSILDFARRVAAVVEGVSGRKVVVSAPEGARSASSVRFCSQLANPVQEPDAALDDYLRAMTRALVSADSGSGVGL